MDVWSLEVVLYICLCGFPPFSDELYSAESPYNLSQQIKMGHFDYPSPYWDNIGDPALDLIDRMLTVDVDQRITIDECLDHPWIYTKSSKASVSDSTDGLTGAMSGLDFSKRKPARERTLLAEINDIKISKVIETADQNIPVKVYEKNKEGKRPQGDKAAQDQPPSNTPNGQINPASEARVDVFMELGGKGDQQLFEAEEKSRYKADEVP